MRLHSLGARLQLTAGTAVNTQKHRKFRLSQEYQAKKHTSCDSTCKKNGTWVYAQLVIAIWELQFLEFASQCLANQQFHFQSQQSLRRAAMIKISDQTYDFLRFVLRSFDPHVDSLCPTAGFIELLDSHICYTATPASSHIILHHPASSCILLHLQ